MIINNEIYWNVKIKASPSKVYEMLNTAEGRSKFWAESASEKEECVYFKFPNNQEYVSRIINRVKNKEWTIDYFNSLVNFTLESPDKEYTILKMVNRDVPKFEIEEVNAGWVSVLLSLKCACQWDLDLRNHDLSCTWDDHYVGN